MSIKVDPDWWKTLFDEVYLKTDARSVCDDDLTRREVELFRSLVPIAPGDRVLDLCGGQGRHSLELSASCGADCTVLDYSQFLIDTGTENAQKAGLRVTFLQADARSTELEGGSFDHVLILGNSLGYLPEPDDDARIVAEAFRILAPGGWLLVDVADGELIRRELAPVSWHEVDDDLVVCRQRKVVDDRVYAREMVISKDKGLIRDNTYAIRTYSHSTLVGLLDMAGFGEVALARDFRPHDENGDYGFMNRRVVVTGRKPTDG